MRNKLVTGLQGIQDPALEAVFQEENFDNCLSMIHNLYATRGSNGDNLQNTLKMVVAEIPVA